MIWSPVNSLQVGAQKLVAPKTICDILGMHPIALMTIKRAMDFLPVFFGFCF
jgi:hypothetical protein